MKNLFAYLLYWQSEVSEGTNIELVFSFKKQSKPIRYLFPFVSYLVYLVSLGSCTYKKSALK